jgi:hypothetical protein
MRYSYRIQKLNTEGTFYIIEYKNFKFFKWWDINTLKETYFQSSNLDFPKSFIRTKKWTLNNYPELLL